MYLFGNHYANYWYNTNYSSRLHFKQLGAGGWYSEDHIPHIIKVSVAGSILVQCR